MALLFKHFLLNNQSVQRLNVLVKLQSYTKCIRHMHFLNNQHNSTVIITSNLLGNPCSVLNSSVYNQVRFKKNSRKSSSKHEESDDDDNDDDYDDDDDDDNESRLNEFKDGNISDKHLSRIKVQTLRLDAVIKAAFGFSKSKTEKLFYDSKIRMNGQKITKKSIDITKECQIDIIKGPSPDNDDFIIVNRIDILDVKASNLNFVMTIRRQKNLTIEDYE